MGKIYRTAQGRQLDMETIRLQNELVPAIGNMRVNARGDQLGPGGKIIKTREMIMDEYYKASPAPLENIPQQGSIPTRSNPSRKRSDPLPTSSKKAATFTPEDAEPDEIVFEAVKEAPAPKAKKAKVPKAEQESKTEKSETKLKGGLAAAIAKTKSTEKKVKRID
jgi:hypothetical protein